MAIIFDPLRRSDLLNASPAPVVEADRVQRFQDALNSKRSQPHAFDEAFAGVARNATDVEAMIALQTRLTILSDEVDAGSKVLGKTVQTVDMLLKGS